MIRKVNAVVIFVDDLDRMRAFYQKTLGLVEVVSDDVSFALQMDGQDFAVVKVAAGAEMLNAQVLAGQPRQRVMLCADVEDVDAAYVALMDKGVTFIKPPIDQAWGWRTAYFADPEGTLWELRQSLPSRD